MFRHHDPGQRNLDHNPSEYDKSRGEPTTTVASEAPDVGAYYVSALTSTDQLAIFVESIDAAMTSDPAPIPSYVDVNNAFPYCL